MTSPDPLLPSPLEPDARFAAERGPDGITFRGMSSREVHAFRRVPLRSEEELAALLQNAVAYDSVEALAGTGMPQAEIALHLRVTVQFLRDNFSAQLDRGASFGRQSLRMAQLRVADAGNVPMLIHLGKVLLGQSDAHLKAQLDREQATLPASPTGTPAPAASLQEAGVQVVRYRIPENNR
jgi:hypothetical protein